MSNDEPIPLGDDDPIELSDGPTEPADPTPTGESAPPSANIRQFATPGHVESKWNCKPNLTGQGATHVKTFHAKLRLDSLEYLDQQINEWLDNHPEIEVKFVTSNVGELRGKTIEPALFVNVWV